MKDINKTFLNSKEVSEYLLIPLRTVQHLTNEGKIKAIRVGRKWRYKKIDIDQYFNLGIDFSKEPTRIPNNFIERRAYPRINSNFRCQYSINLPPFRELSNEGIVKDVSAGGIFLFNQSNKIDEIKAGDPIDLNFVLIFDNEKRLNINIKGKIIRKSPDGAGIKFKRINKETQNKIIEYAG